MDEDIFDHLGDALCEFVNDSGFDDETFSTFQKLIANAEVDIQMIGFTSDKRQLRVTLTSRGLTGSEQCALQEEMECV